MTGTTTTLFMSDHYKVSKYQCHCDICSISNAEYNDSFCFSFIQTGYFEYCTFRKKDDVHTGRILLSKPGFPHTTRHVDGQPDITTTFHVHPAFLPVLTENYCREAGWFLLNQDIHSIVLHSDPALDHLHHHFLQLIRPLSVQQVQTKLSIAGKLQVDELVLHLLERIMNKLGNKNNATSPFTTTKHFHLPIVEQAQAYMLTHFKEDISLQDLATHCCTSLFHFSRIFKAVLHCSPHQYLLGIRLHEAQEQLRLTEKAISDIAFDSGFNSLEHFTTAYKKKYGISPSTTRKLVV